MYKAYKAEFILGLIGSIIGTIAFVLSIFFGMAWAFFGGILIPIITALLLLWAFICGYQGVGMLKRNNKKGGVILIVAGGLSAVALILCFVAAWFACFSMVPLLIGGIMVLARKPQAPPVI